MISSNQELEQTRSTVTTVTIRLIQEPTMTPLKAERAMMISSPEMVTIPFMVMPEKIPS